MGLTLYLVTARYDFSDDHFLTVIEEACKMGSHLFSCEKKIY